MGRGPQKRSLAAGAGAVDPVFSWFSPSPPLNGLFAFVFLSSPFSSEHPCDPTSCNFPPLVHRPPHGGLLIGGPGNGAPPPSKRSPYAIIYDPRARDADSQRIQFEFAEFAANSFAARIRCEFGLKFLVLRIRGEFALRIRGRRQNDHACAVFSPDEKLTLNSAMQ